MDQQTVVEKLKELENDINLKAKVRGFKVEITDYGDNTGTIKVWNLSKNSNRLSEFIGMMTFVETLDIEGIADFQITIKKNNEILEHGLFLDKITQ